MRNHVLQDDVLAKKKLLDPVIKIFNTNEVSNSTITKKTLFQVGGGRP